MQTQTGSHSPWRLLTEVSLLLFARVGLSLVLLAGMTISQCVLSSCAELVLLAGGGNGGGWKEGGGGGGGVWGQ